MFIMGFTMRETKTSVPPNAGSGIQLFYQLGSTISL